MRVRATPSDKPLKLAEVLDRSENVLVKQKDAKHQLQP